MAKRLAARRRRKPSLRMRERAVLLENIREAVVVLDDRGHIVFANGFLRDLLGYTPDEVQGRRLQVLLAEGEALDVPPHADGSRTAFVLAAPRSGPPVPVEVSFGRWIPLTKGRRLLPALLRGATDRAEAEASRAEAQAEHRRAALLGEAGRILVSTRGPSALELLARLLAEGYAEACFIDLQGPEGARERVAEAWAEGVRPRDDEAIRSAIDESSRTGQARLLATVGEAGGRVSIIAPLLSSEKAIGVLTCVGAPGPPAYVAADLALACELAREIALALTQAQLLSRALHRIGHGLVVLAKQPSTGPRRPFCVGSC